ncbi:MAG: cadherin repeat domain-containing protein, partial [Gammaproteobacteria bacterium]|nr:cadherin repeat domain-containing protein [Gammaproteobacteria bacterium]
MKTITLTRLILATCSLVLSAQSLALDFTQTTKNTNFILNDTNKTIRVTLDDFAVYLPTNLTFHNSSGTEIDKRTLASYAGVGTSEVRNNIRASNSNIGEATVYKTWDLTLNDNTINIIKADSSKIFTLTTIYRTNPNQVPRGNFLINDNEWLPQRTLTLCWENCNLAITSTDTLTANEGETKSFTLQTNNPSATFTLLENPSTLFSLSGTNNATLTFTGTTTDFESTTTSYTVKVKATTGSATTQNTTQEITLKLTDLNDETPSNITLTNTTPIPENSKNIKIATLTATDPDANDTFTYTALNTTLFEIRNTNELHLKPNTNLDYEQTKSISTQITVTDAAHHTYTPQTPFTFQITDLNDEPPTNITLSTPLIPHTTQPNTQVATLTTTDPDTIGTHTYTLTDTTQYPDNTAFTLTTDGKLTITQTPNYTTKPTYTIHITVTDGITPFSKPLTLTVQRPNLHATKIFITNANGAFVNTQSTHPS